MKSCGNAIQAGAILAGRDTSRAFVYFVFLPKLKSDVAWANSEMRPNLILLNWPDPVGYFFHSFSIANLFIAWFCAGLPVMGFQYARFHGRKLLDLGPVRRVSKRFRIAFAAAAVVMPAVYALPIFHNIVLLYFGFVGLVLIVFLKRFRLSGASRIKAAPMSPKSWLGLGIILAAAFFLRADQVGVRQPKNILIGVIDNSTRVN